jgi:hypothetical protein
MVAESDLKERVAALDLGWHGPVRQDVEAAARRRLRQQDAGRLDALTGLPGHTDDEIVVRGH